MGCLKRRLLTSKVNDDLNSMEHSVKLIMFCWGECDLDFLYLLSKDYCTFEGVRLSVIYSLYVFQGL